MTEQEIISDEEIEKVHGNANFGYPNKRMIVQLGVLKCASGYHMGYTAQCICVDHGLITPKTYKLTEKGRKYLWAAYSKGSNF
jgi:hypothetical protein